jgi:hypothetical protein
MTLKSQTNAPEIQMLFDLLLHLLGLERKSRLVQDPPTQQKQQPSPPTPPRNPRQMCVADLQIELLTFLCGRLNAPGQVARKAIEQFIILGINQGWCHPGDLRGRAEQFISSLIDACEPPAAATFLLAVLEQRPRPGQTEISRTLLREEEVESTDSSITTDPCGNPSDLIRTYRNRTFQVTYHLHSELAEKARAKLSQWLASDVLNPEKERIETAINAYEAGKPYILANEELESEQISSRYTSGISYN